MNFYPAPYNEQPLTENDFNRLFIPFSQVLKKKIPTISEIIFLSGKSDIKKHLDDSEKIAYVEEILLRSQQDPDMVYVLKDCFILPFPVGDATIVAVIQGVDPFLVKKADHAWLIEMRNSALHEFSLLKRKRIDQYTGLLNTENLHDLLEILSDSTDVSLMLIELYPRVQSSAEAILFSRRAALALTNFAVNRFPLHYLGHGVFALVTDHGKEESASHLGAMLILWLRRENFPHVHIGYSRKTTPNAPLIRQPLLDEAWEALQVACKRGPFSFCDFSQLSHPENHPLRRPSKQVLAKFSRKWRHSERFSIVQFQADHNEQLSACLATFIEGIFIWDNDDFYVFLDAMDSRQALDWVYRKTKDIKKKLGKDNRLSAGIGTYPFADFSKSEIPYNCRKALLHAAFFGPGGVAVFDAVSLNISGDIFYGDGDLESAVREYKRGLVCDANNINLLNSLGVAYAMMDRHKMAHLCFNRVLALDADNFMALYNLGLGEELLGHNKSALVRFERAIAVHPDDTENKDIRKDLQFQLGRLYCATGEYQKAVDMLLLWHGNSKGTKNAGRAFRYLGKSFHGLGKNDEAMTWLQRALQFDGFDAEAMGLLGEIYLEQKEGDDIALTLCEKSVDLDPQNPLLRLRLVKAQRVCRKYTAAQSNLRGCLRNKETKAEAQLQNGLICLDLKQTRKAATWFGKILGRNNVDPKITEKAFYYFKVTNE
jgi:tetratricopeptide (TPR) repeat protein